MSAGKTGIAGTLIRGLLLRCPNCGEGKVFEAASKLNDRCSECQHQFDRESGYFLGSIYINYGVTAVLITGTYTILHFGYGIANETVLPVAALFTIFFPFFFHRYSRSLWLALDAAFDTTQDNNVTTSVSSAPNSAVDEKKRQAGLAYIRKHDRVLFGFATKSNTADIVETCKRIRQSKLQRSQA